MPSNSKPLVRPRNSGQKTDPWNDFLCHLSEKNLPEEVSNRQDFSLADRKIKFQFGLQIVLPVNCSPQITGRQKQLF